jgi:hypothetical protein
VFIHREFGNGGFYAMGAVLMLAFAPLGMCQTEPEQESDSASSELPEEITVYGDKSLPSLRRQLFKAEENVFLVFNSLNSKSEYDVHCDYEFFLGSRKRRHVCKPKFYIRIQADNAEAMMSDHGFPGLSNGIVAKKEKLLWEDMAALAYEHPELRKAFVKLAELNQVWDSQIRRRCDDSPIIRCRK